MNENKERDELGFAVSWRRALSSLYNYVSWLHSYCQINSVAAQKIIIKINKHFGSKGINVIDLNTELKEYEFVSKIDEVIDLRKNIQHFYANHITQGNLVKASHELEERMRGNRKKDVALISFNLGLLISLCFCLIMLFFINCISCLFSQ
jgi:hypothetical protein